ncbi:MAG: hypothetical protein QOH14_1841, partial [Pseudonocardiales bacterium]|nr:hypothetical protein [Pseudonocardiales bacterium]
MSATAVDLPSKSGEMSHRQVMTNLSGLMLGMFL